MSSDSLIIHGPFTIAGQNTSRLVDGAMGGLRVTARWPKVARICAQCSGEFQAALYAVRRGKGRFCSPSCRSTFALIKRHRERPQVGSANPCWRGGVSQSNYRYTQRFRLRHPEKHDAQKAVAAAIRRGDLARPSACESCSAPCRPHGHHDDYSKPLSVRWLCRACHRIADRQRKAA